jgi:hypothetical protein
MIRCRSGTAWDANFSTTKVSTLMTTPQRLRAIKDRRSTWSRRHKELADAFAADVGIDLSAADRSLVDHAATVAVECERLKARQLNDEPLDIDDLVRLTNSLTRVRIELGKRAAAKNEPDPDEWGRIQDEADRLAGERR